MRVSVDAPASPPTSLDQVPGWLKKADELLFTWILTEATPEPGDLLEIGVFRGRTAIHIGKYRRERERFTVCDLFDLARDDLTIRPGARAAYKDLTQAEFERNYLAFHPELPTIIRAHSEAIAQHVQPGSLRFAHIDGSHIYEHVRHDLLAVRDLMPPDGIVVLDDYRTEHCPGVSAAVWEGVITHGLKIVAVTANKFYGTWGDAQRAQRVIMKRAGRREDVAIDVQTVLGQQLLRVVVKRRPTPDGGRPGVLNKPSRRPAWRRVALAILPPPVADALQRARRRRRTSTDGNRGTPAPTSPVR